MKQFQRFELQVGENAINNLSKCHIAVFGLGGVGGNVVEALVRSGASELTIIDKDVVDETNINRQIIATHSTIGKLKVDVCEQRAKDINQNIKINKEPIKFDENSEIDFANFDYVVDAVDDVNAKIEVIKRAFNAQVPVISCMGAGNKFDPLALKVSEISKTSVCPLARLMRNKLKELSISGVKCVFSTEQPLKIDGNTISSNVFMPATAGILIAREVFFDLINKKEK